jgi:glutamate formiminotransferase/formiminotetrahydrofolate cyclodeaminase
MESKRQSVSFADLTVGQFVERLSSAEPVPGGGAASALAAALGASLVAMVAGLSAGRPKYAVYEDTLSRADAAGTELAAELLQIADKDAEAYVGYAAALKLPRETDLQIEARRAAIRSAARLASDAPWDCVRACLRLAEVAEALAGRSNVNASSDVLVAALLAEAGARGAAENVRINLPSTGDEEYSEALSRQLDEMLHDISALASRTREIVLSGGPRDPETETEPEAEAETEPEPEAE